MVAGNTFAGGEESIYHVTKAGFERKAELCLVRRSGVRDCVTMRPRWRSAVE